MVAKPANVFAYIRSNNLASQKLFKKFNFNLRQMLTDKNYVRAETKEPKLIPDTASSEPGK